MTLLTPAIISLLSLYFINSLDIQFNKKAANRWPFLVLLVMEKCMDHGMNDFVAKPFDAQDLDQKIKAILIDA